VNYLPRSSNCVMNSVGDVLLLSTRVPYHERLYDAVSHTLTLTLTKSSIASTANCFPRLPTLDIVYIISSLPRLPHTALVVVGKRQHYYQLLQVEYWHQSFH